MLQTASKFPDVVSRYDSQREVAVMQRMLGALSPAVLRRIDSVFCDSKASACYSIKLNDVPCGLIAEEIEDAFLKVDDGHNGIWLEGPANSQFVINPNWKQDW